MDNGKVFISHDSALQFWRHHDLSRAGGIKRCRNTSVRTGTSLVGELKPMLRCAAPSSGRIFGARPSERLETALVDLKIQELPLHVMVGTKAMQRQSSNIVTHYYEMTFPEGSFCRVGKNVFVASPELTLCQLASSLPLVDVIELCLEFCSGYALNPESERGFDDRPALTTARRLAGFVERFKGRHGAKAMRQALRYVVDDSRSPMESHVLMLLCLPSKLGGYQLPMPKHNESIPVTERARSHTRKKYLVCDLYWEKYHLDVECDSTRYHTSKHQLGADSNRRIILDAMHCTHVSVTTWQLEDANEFLDIVQAIRRAMGLKLRNAPEHVAANREKLRVYLTTPQGKRPALRFVTNK